MAFAEQILRRLDRAHRQAPLFVGSVVGLAVLLLGSSLVAWQNNREQQRLSASYERTLAVLDAVNAHKVASLTALRGERGYLITGHPARLDRYFEGKAGIASANARLEKLSRESTAARSNIAELRSDSKAYLQVLEEVIELKRQGRDAEASEIVRNGEGQAAINAVTDTLQRIETDERERLATIASRVRLATRTQLHFLYLASFAGACLLVFASAVVVALRRAFAREARYRKELRRLASTDELTGIANRRELILGLERALSAARRTGAPLSFAIVDIDHFKRVNDTYGHPAGDEVIRRIAGRTLSAVRGCDLVGRLGGEEFAIVLPGADAAAAYAVCERLRESIQSHGVTLADGRILRVTASTGVAPMEAGDTPETLMERSDRALYEAKRGGRDQVRLAA